MSARWNVREQSGKVKMHRVETTTRVRKSSPPDLEAGLHRGVEPERHSGFVFAFCPILDNDLSMSARWPGKENLFRVSTSPPFWYHFCRSRRFAQNARWAGAYQLAVRRATGDRLLESLEFRAPHRGWFRPPPNNADYRSPSSPQDSILKYIVSNSFLRFWNRTVK